MLMLHILRGFSLNECGADVMTETEAVVFIVDNDAPMRESLKKLIRSIGLRAELFASEDG